MSHVSCIDVVIKDLDSLQSTAKELGLEFIENQKTYMWFGKWVKDYHSADAAYKHGIDPNNYGKCEHVLKIKGDNTAYEIGVVKKADGTYSLIWDFWGPQGDKLRKIIGNKGEKLLQGYSKEVAVKQLAKKGFKVQKVEKLENGKLKVVLRG